VFIRGFPNPLSSFLFPISGLRVSVIAIYLWFLFVFSNLSIGRGFEISFLKNTDFMHPFAAGSLYLFCTVH